MNLDRVTVNIRPRNSWEAMDIGFSIARSHFGRLFLLWWLTALPLITIIAGVSFLIPGESSLWFLLLFWLFKPLYEPPMLLWISRTLFGDSRSVLQTLREIRSFYTPRRITGRLLTRLSPYRSYLLPVIMLEGLEGKKLRSRKSFLRSSYETPVLLSIAGYCIEILAMYSLLILLYWCIPEELRWINLGDFVFNPERWLTSVSYCIACSFIAPFYTCAGFMMYISRRVEFEAWDIEIGFKKIRQRLLDLKQAKLFSAILLFLLSATLSLSPVAGSAETVTPQRARKVIEEVRQQKDFGEKITRYHWVPVEKKKKTKEKEPSWLVRLLDSFFDRLGNLGVTGNGVRSFLGSFGQIFLCCAAGALLGFLLLKNKKLRAWLSGRFGTGTAPYTPPEVMFGMNLRPESLPDDIAAASLNFLGKGEIREAISLLYRGTLSRLINRYGLHLHASFTEKECTGEVRKSRPDNEADCFRQLTGLWTMIAYGHRNPDTDRCREFIARWQTIFGTEE